MIDTPGILDRPLEERNNIEMTAITALAHLEATILYFVDISEVCGMIFMINFFRLLHCWPTQTLQLNKTFIQEQTTRHGS